MKFNEDGSIVHYFDNGEPKAYYVIGWNTHINEVFCKFYSEVSEFDALKKFIREAGTPMGSDYKYLEKIQVIYCISADTYYYMHKLDKKYRVME